MRKLFKISRKAIEEFYGSYPRYVTHYSLGPGHSEGRHKLPVKEEYDLSVLANHGPVSYVKVHGIGDSAFLPVLRKDLIEVELPDAIVEFKEVLESLHPGHYYMPDDNGIIYIHYPELTITNSHDASHKIYDLVVNFTVDPTNGTLLSSLYGMRFSLSQRELAKGYIHSHLKTNYHSFNNPFCLGGGSTFQKMVNNLCCSGSVTKEQFELFILQLNSYLCWESLEGTPHMSILSLSGAIADSGDSAFRTTDEILNLEKLGGKTCMSFIDTNLDSIYFTPLGIPVFDPGLVSKKFFDFEVNTLTKIVAGAHLKQWNEDTGQYVVSGVNQTSNTYSLPRDVLDYYESYRLNKHLPGIKPRVIEEEQNTNKTKTITRLSRTAIEVVTRGTNSILIQALNKHAKRTNPKEGSTSSSNREVSRANTLPA